MGNVIRGPSTNGLDCYPRGYYRRKVAPKPGKFPPNPSHGDFWQDPVTEAWFAFNDGWHELHASEKSLEEECARLRKERDEARRSLASAEARIASLNGHITFQHIESWAKVSDALGPQEGGMSLCQQTVAAIRERNELRESCDAWEKIANEFGRTITRIEDVLDETWSGKGVEP